MSPKNLATLFVFWGMLTSTCFSQLSLEKSYAINNPGIASVDYIGNYYLQNNNELWMFNRFDTLYRKFSIINMASITQIDATNALKIQLYYRELGKIMYLDNNISDFTSAISLNDIDLAQSTLVCSSYDNAFWVYLPGAMSIYRYDSQLKRTVSIESVSRFIRKDLLEPVFMKEYSNQLYVFFPGYGLVVFDIFGAYVQTLPVQELVYPDIQSGQLIDFKNDTLFFRQLNDFNQSSTLALPHLEGLQSVEYSSGKVYMLTKDHLYIYKLPT